MSAPSGSLDVVDPDLLQHLVLHSSSPCLCLLWLENLPVQTEAKNLLSTLASSMSWVTISFLPEKTHIHASLPFITDIPTQEFPIAVDVPGQL